MKLFGSSKDADCLVRAYYDEIYIFVARQNREKNVPNAVCLHNVFGIHCGQFHYGHRDVGMGNYGGVPVFPVCA